ncbi:isoleucyl-tRNA synthetase [Basidiobolus meristosporus CBS 931.73]|uniref:Isoleucine--tRNA ligase, mitochondrial n=1 Tax=Basidiobolus meristosporus CBS 931.73 TaxID=1314790 RepID=A0A1Y1XWW9_9FUNG|nr:isoleucyl-tRNA synthetase [Basidiobolus meristosporus CBS 931.73]|eukprot:ORX90165.1 isoleucyl-tRNA synthetase [Basidiobolus meristosporus CBS 931.73]
MFRLQSHLRYTRSVPFLGLQARGLQREKCLLARSLSSSCQLKAKETKDTTDSINKKFSNTLLLPSTKFPLRADAAKREGQFRSRCTDELYPWQLKNNPGDYFVLHDGPPYANGDLHTGHALNKILKDIINRYKVLQGYKVHYIPGWDCHGLPIELKALSGLRSSEKQNLTPQKIREEARKCALNAVEKQKADFTSWGVMGDWENAYKTLGWHNPGFEVRQLEIFRQMVQKGYIYRQHRPVYWSPSSKTALAEAELEYKDDHESRSAYVKYPIVSLELLKGPDLSNVLPDSPDFKLNALIWTTTPWTLPANKAIAVNPELQYTIFAKQSDGAEAEHFVCASERLETVKSLFQDNESISVITELPGSKLLGSEYQNFITKEKLQIIPANYVSSESGTGMVHTAPGHGKEDYLACVKLGIPIACPVDDNGVFTEEAGPLFSGKPVLTQGTEAVINFMEEHGYLIKQEKYIHSYPYDWRTKKPVIQRATSQWFANVTELRGDAVDAIRDIKIIPETGHRRLSKFLESRTEWCISRQRSWGVPIPVIYDEETDEPLLKDEIVTHIKDLVSKHGTDCWWTLPVEELLPPTYRDNGTDTMDVWFDSGTSWTLIREALAREGDHIADVYLEGSDQHRGWFQSSLLTSVASTGKAPYGTLITHGFVLDEKGRKMSKSIGNVLEPSIIIKGGKARGRLYNLKKNPAYGTDILRLWVASTEYTKDVAIGDTIIAHVADSMRKYRNTARFMLGNLGGFSNSKRSSYDQLHMIDKYIIHQLHQFGQGVTSAYDDFTFNRVVQELNNFTNTSLSAFYFDIVKDRLYADKADSVSRLNVQTVLSNILDVYTRALAPITCHLSEEIYENAKHIYAEPSDSVFKTGWLNIDPAWKNDDIGREVDCLKALRSEVNLLLEKARKDKIIGSSLEADVGIVFDGPSPVQKLFSKYVEVPFTNEQNGI